jgi:hypothetical protein
MISKKPQLPTGISIDGKYLSFNSIFYSFSRTNYGNTLKSNIRFSYFKPKHISSKDWENTLGKDVSNLYHLYVSLQITRNFLIHCSHPNQKWHNSLTQEAKFNSEEQKILLFTSVIHDWAEAVIGDIDFAFKKQSDEKQELIILKDLLNQILGDGKNNKDLNRIGDTVTSILKEKNSKLGKAFNAIEKIGYLKTGMKAWLIANKNTNEISKDLKHLASRVVNLHTAKLIEYSDIYPFIYSYLYYRKGAISEIIKETQIQDDNLVDKWSTFIKQV